MSLWRRIFGPSRRELLRRVEDLERHFVTKRDPASGAVVETLADVPVEKREKLRRLSTAGMTWPQRKKLLEATDGGRNIG
jgi:hypothetical protein